MAIPTKDEWVKMRNAAKVKKGAVKGVSLTDLLDAYEKAWDKSRREKNTASGAAPELMALAKGVQKYKDQIKKKNPAFAKTIEDKIEKEVQKVHEQFEKLAQPVANLSNQLKKCRQALSKMPANPTTKEYGDFHNEYVRAVGTAWPAVVKLDPPYSDLQAAWDPLNALVNVDQDKVKTTLTKIGTTMEKVIAEGNKRNLFKI